MISSVARLGEGRWIHNIHQIQQHKTQRHPLRFDTKQPFLGQIEVHHASKQHVIKGVNPKRRKEDKNKVRVVGALRGRVLDRDAANDECGCFPDGAHDQDPAEGLFKRVRLVDVVGCCDTKESGKKDCCCEGGTISPHVIGIIEREAFCHFSG